MTTTKNTSTPFVGQGIGLLPRIKLRSMRVRLALWGLFLLVTTQVVVSGVLYLTISAWLQGQVNNNLRLTATQVSSVLYETDDARVSLEIDDIASQFSAAGNIATQGFLDDQLFFVRVINLNNGAVVAASASYPIPVPQRQTDIAFFETVRLTQDGRAHDMRVYTLPLPYTSIYALQTGMSLAETRAIQTNMLRLLGTLLIVTGVLAPLSGWFLANRALVPIHGIARTAAEINETDLSRRLDLATSEIELEQLAQTFNAMLNRIENAFQRQRQFTADAAHELRTPLSIMQTDLDVTLAQARTPVQYESSLRNVREEVIRLSRLANTLLTLARTDTHTLALDRRVFNFSLMLDAIMEQFEATATDKQIELVQEIATDLTINGDEDRLIQVFMNLLDNAVKFTPEGGCIMVIASKQGERVRVIVQDTGPGIPVADHQRVFERFHRVDASRNRDRGGFGLGLAISAQIIALHEGTIRVVAGDHAGTTIEIIL